MIGDIEFLECVVEIYFHNSCTVSEAILQAKKQLNLSNTDFDEIKIKLKSKLLRRIESWNI
ncbi:hypothetical protein OSC52_15415 [Clostridium pasteurianum]|uniref:hypothetical protein n=1 Tax=Clostridium pasteurianum TaxID=1501 RepID=UPI002260D3C8|nr:hypothetical protein [Clostridium pasteurianum]UZW13225.1 hypothetical protein OSC52_15415 [Clostridium pasteurianum]